MDVTPINELPKLPRRSANAHKGTFGKVLVLAGSRGMSGAAVLCGLGALRAGAGLVQVACPACVQPEVAAGNPCYTTFGLRQHADGTLGDGVLTDVVELAKAASVLALGPGLGRSADVVKLVAGVIRELSRLPIVIDADGLNALAPFTDAFKSRTVPLVLTPHRGEFERLAGSEVDPDREKASVQFAERFGVVLLLKGMGTLVTDGSRLYRNSTGNPGMATGGSGDVLTGVIAALLAQKMSPFDAAVLGAWVHGRAGDLAMSALGQTGLTAADIAEALPFVFKELESSS